MKYTLTTVIILFGSIAGHSQPPPEAQKKDNIVIVSLPGHWRQNLRTIATGLVSQSIPIASIDSVHGTIRTTQFPLYPPPSWVTQDIVVMVADTTADTCRFWFSSTMYQYMTTAGSWFPAPVSNKGMKQSPMKLSFDNFSRIAASIPGATISYTRY